jgi:hypothetical protein
MKVRWRTTLPYAIEIILQPKNASLEKLFDPESCVRSGFEAAQLGIMS